MQGIFFWNAKIGRRTDFITKKANGNIFKGIYKKEEEVTGEMGRRGGEYMNGKRVLVYFLAVCMSLALAACGGKDGGSAAVSSKEYVY